MRALWRRGEELFAEVVAPEGVDVTGFGIHPALFDAVFHPLLVADPADELRLPFELRGLRLYEAGAGTLRVRLTRTGPDGCAIEAAGPSGRPVFSLDSLRARPVLGRVARHGRSAAVRGGVGRGGSRRAWLGGAGGGVVCERVGGRSGGGSGADLARACGGEAGWGVTGRVRDAAGGCGRCGGVGGLVRSAQSEQPGRFVLAEVPEGFSGWDAVLASGGSRRYG
ncbi:polyketide synthase dehydratase domain-containing protein [Nonomuraea ferruginea]